MHDTRTTLLVAERDENTRAFLLTNLAADGYEPLGAQSDEETRLKLRNHSPALLVLGGLGEDRQPLALVRAVRAGEAGGDRCLPVIVLGERGELEGRLYGCHNDVSAMREIADALGYRSSVLLDDQATADGVSAAIRDAARSLSPGDVFLLTYSGHGGQVDDINGDESLREQNEFGETADKYDETWVLFDRMLIDDELWALWAEFKPGVRIDLVSDSCHSGTVAKAAPPAVSGEVELGRRIPLDVEVRTYQLHKDLYDGIQDAVPPREASGIGATVLLDSGCQDDQTSADGRGNGLFTGTLLEVWQDGQFRGSVEQLCDAISGARGWRRSGRRGCDSARGSSARSCRPS